MYALIGYLVVTIATGVIVGRTTGWARAPSERRSTLDLADTARKVQSVLSSLAGFAVTSLVLLITLSASRLDMSQERNVDLIAMLVVAYLGFVVGAIMYAYTEPVVTRTGLDLLAASTQLLPASSSEASCRAGSHSVRWWPSSASIA